MSERRDRIDLLANGIERAKAAERPDLAEIYAKEYQQLVQEEVSDRRDESPIESNIVGGINAIGQGTLYDFADEIGGFLDSGSVSGPDYTTERDLRREGIKQFKDEAPGYLGEVLEFGGGMIGPGGVGAIRKGASEGLSGIKKGLSWLVEGAGQGALAGAGGAEELEDVAGDAAISGGIGSLLNTGLNSAVSGLSKVWGRYGEDAFRYLSMDDKGKAEELIGRVVKTTGENPDSVMAYLKRLGPEASLMDINDALRTFTSAITNKSDEAMTTVTGFLDDRKAGVNTRLKELISPDDYGSTKAAREDLRRSTADKLYDFDGAEIPVTKELNDFLNHPLVKRELGDIELKESTVAKEPRQFLNPKVPKEELPMVKGYLESGGELSEDMLNDPSVKKLLESVDPKVRIDLMDSLKKRLDEQGAAKSKNPITGESDRAGRRAYETLSRDLRDIADPANPQYAAAREADKYHGDILRAGESGEGIVKTKGRLLDDLGDEVSDMTPDQRRQFELAGEDTLYRHATGQAGPDAAKARKLLAGEDMNKRLDLVSGDDAAKRGRLQEGLEAEDVFHETSRLVDPGMGSRTAVLDMASDRADTTAADIGKFGVDVMTFGNPIATSVRAVEGMLSDRTITPRQAAALSEILTNRNLSGSDIKRMIDRVPELSSEVKESLTRMIFDRAATAGSVEGAQEGAQMF